MMDKSDAAKILYRCAQDYNENLRGRNLLFLYAGNSMKEICALEVQFDDVNFLHLTGIKFGDGQKVLSANDFFHLCLHKRLSPDAFEMDGNCALKLAALPQMVCSANLGANMIGEYNGRHPVLKTGKLAGNIRACMGLVFDEKRKRYFPNTVLNLDMRAEIKAPQRVLAIYRRKTSESEYKELVYKAKKVLLSELEYPAPFAALPR